MDYASSEIAGNQTLESDPGPRFGARPTQTGLSRQRNAIVAVVEDGVRISRELWAICEFLDIEVVRYRPTAT